MADQVYPTSPIIGVSFNLKTTSPTHKLGLVVPVTSTNPAYIGRFAMYVHAGTTALGVSAYATVDLTTTDCTATSVAYASASGMYRNGSVAFAAGDYGWVYSTNRGVYFGPLYQGL